MSETNATVKDYVYEYGKFIILFEKICENLRMRIKELVLDKLTSESVLPINILLEGLTAYPISDKYLSVYIAKFGESGEHVQLVRKIKNVAQDLLNLRNDLAHGVTIFGWNEQGETQEINGIKVIHHRLSAKGLNENIKHFNLSQLKTLNSQVELFNDAVFIARILNLNYSKQVVDAHKQMISKIVNTVNFDHTKYEPA